MTTNYQIIFCTFPTVEQAMQCAQDLVAQKIAACVNVLPAMTSVYAWQGEIETAQEHLLMIKTQANYYAQIENWLKSNHPYEIPEIIALPVEQGLPDYLNWISACHVLS